MAEWKIDSPNTEYYDHQTPGLEAVINEVMATPEVAIDTETTGLVNWKDVPLYFSLAWGNRRMTLNVSALHYFANAFADKNKRWLFANAKYDAHILANVGVNIAGKLVDTTVMHALLYEERPHGLKDMNMHLFGWKWQDFEDTFGKIGKKNSATDVIRRAEQENFPLLCEYAANDAWGTLKVYEELRKQLQLAPTHSLFRSGYLSIETLWDLFDKVEVPYTKVLWHTERNGIKVNVEYLDSIAPQAIAEIEELEREICKEAGKVINPNSTKQLREYFFDKLQIKPLKMSKGGVTGVRNPSVDEKFLEHYSSQIPMARMLLRHRGLKKLYSTYIMGLREKMDPRGRIHSRFNQDVARCMPAGELVLTNKGYLPVEKVKVGYQVLSHTEVPRTVIETSTHAPQPIYAVTLTNGVKLRTTGNHEYLTTTSWVRADQLTVEHEVLAHSNKEQWKKIEGWPDFSISSWGRVRNDTTQHYLKSQPKGKWGHLKVTLHRNGAQQRGKDRKDFTIHRLVLSAFSAGEGETRHLNGVAWDNTLTNLKYGTSAENSSDAVRHGTVVVPTKLSLKAVEYIKSCESPGQPPSSTSKLSYATAEQIRERHRSGESRRDLALEFGVSYVAIDNIIKNKTWKTPAKQGYTASELAEHFGVSPATIRDIWADRKWQKTEKSKETCSAFFPCRVEQVTVEEPEVTYGLTVEIDHSHVTGGIVTHNTGRLSSSAPNMQNIPKPENDKWGLRGAFIADEGNVLSVVDYEQLEMRLLAAASGEPGMCEVIHRGWDIHMGNASMIFNIPYEEIKAAKKTPEEHLTSRQKECLAARAAAKNIGFGLIYGMGPDKLANSLGCSRSEAEVKIKAFKEAYPAVDAFTREAVAETEQTGYAFTILGRRRNVPEIASHRRDERMKGERIAVNTQIQGSAADVVKMAQILLFKSGIDKRYGAIPNLQVHDELMHEGPKETAQPAHAEIMEWMQHPFPTDLLVPLGVSGNIGKSWADAK